MSINYTSNQNPFNITPGGSFPTINADRDPAVTDNFYPLNTEWKNTVSGTVFKFIGNQIISSVANALWDPYAGGTSAGDISFLTGNSGGAVTGSASGNVNILGASGQVVVTGDPGTNTLTISLAGAGTAIDSLTPDSGGAVSASASGNVNILGTSSQIVTTGSPSTNTLTLSFPDTISVGHLIASAAIDSFPVITGIGISSANNAENTIYRSTYRSLTAPAAGFGNVLGFLMSDSALADATYAEIIATVVSSTAAAHSASLNLDVATNGTVATGAKVLGSRLELATSSRLRLGSGGVDFCSGTGDPNTSVTAAKGSLYMRTDGSGANTRAYINTDGVTAWTGVATQGTEFDSIIVQVFTSNGTYTPTTGMKYCTVEVVGAGGGSGGAANTSGSQFSSSGGGGGGGYAKKTFSAATIGSSQVVTVGTGGPGGSAGNNNGTAGGTSSLGSLISATGGAGGSGGAASGTPLNSFGGLGGVGSNGDINVTGGPGGFGFAAFSLSYAAEANGGSTFYAGETTESSGIAAAGNTPGGGAAGAVVGASDSAKAGAAGGNGTVIITEYISS